MPLKLRAVRNEESIQYRTENYKVIEIFVNDRRNLNNHRKPVDQAAAIEVYRLSPWMKERENECAARNTCTLEFAIEIARELGEGEAGIREIAMRKGWGNILEQVPLF